MADFQPDKFKPVCQLTFEGAWPLSVAWLGDSRRLAAGNRDGQIYIWDVSGDPVVEAGESEKKQDQDELPVGPHPTRLLEGHTNCVAQLAATQDGKLLMSASFDHSVRYWDPDASPVGKAEVVMDIDQREREAKRNKEALDAPGIEVDKQNSSAMLEGHTDWVTSLGLSADGQRLITGDETGLSIVWDVAGRKEIARWKGHPLTGVCSTALSADGKLAFVAEYRASRGSFDRPPAQARIYNAADGTELVDLLKVEFPDVKNRDNSYGYATTWNKFVGRGFISSAFSPDGKLLAVAQGGEGSGKAHLIDVETGKTARSVEGHKGGCNCVVFSADGKYLLTTGRDTTLRIWNVADGKRVAELGKGRGGQFKDWYHHISLSPDQQWLAATDIAGKVVIWRKKA